MRVLKNFLHRKAALYNGQIVREGDMVSFVSSDGETFIDMIKRRKDGSLYFWNTSHKITDYRNASLCRSRQSDRSGKL